MTTSNEELENPRGYDTSPRPDEPVWVQCEGFRCLAFVDKRGQWRAFYDRTKLAGEVKVIDKPSGK